MKYKFLIITAALFLCANVCFALESVFSHSETSKNIAKNMPVLKMPYALLHRKNNRLDSFKIRRKF
ncbi:MAG: hypothetical protein ACLSA2_00450 [Candidatus Gastranaerophilaceae bacterium]